MEETHFDEVYRLAFTEGLPTGGLGGCDDLQNSISWSPVENQYTIENILHARKASTVTRSRSPGTDLKACTSVGYVN